MLTNRKRLLAIAENTKVQQPRNIAVNTNPLYSTINCNPNFETLIYAGKKCCESHCIYFETIDGGTPSSIPYYFVNGGTPSSEATCFINGGLV